MEVPFDVPDSLGLDSTTLAAALELGGGSGVGGASRNLLRAAVAALLNSAHPDVDYSLTDQQQVIGPVNAALAGGNRDTILALAEDLDRRNNGGCPLN